MGREGVRGTSGGSQSGAGLRGRGSRGEEDGGRMDPLEVLPGRPSSLDSTLRHIVQQLDILTQVSLMGKGAICQLEMLLGLNIPEHEPKRGTLI